MSLVLTDAYFELNSIDLSAFVRKLSLPVEVDEVEDHAMRNGGWKTAAPGLKAAKLGVTFKQSFAASEVDATLWSLLGSIVPFEIRPTSAAVSATNPRYTGSVLVSRYPVFDTEVGQLVEVEVEWPVWAVTRATS